MKMVKSFQRGGQGYVHRPSNLNLMNLNSLDDVNHPATTPTCGGVAGRLMSSMMSYLFQPKKKPLLFAKYLRAVCHMANMLLKCGIVCRRIDVYYPNHRKTIASKKRD